MRFSEDKPADLERARAAVAAWRTQNPDGTSSDMVAAIGGQFHPDYGLVLRAMLFAIPQIDWLRRHLASDLVSPAKAV